MSTLTEINGSIAVMTWNCEATARRAWAPPVLPSTSLDGYNFEILLFLLLQTEFQSKVFIPSRMASPQSPTLGYIIVYVVDVAKSVDFYSAAFGYTVRRLDCSHRSQIQFLTYVDAAYERAVEKGAVPVSAPEVKEWGQKVGYVKDIDGNVVRLGSHECTEKMMKPETGVEHREVKLAYEDQTNSSLKWSKAEADTEHRSNLSTSLPFLLHEAAPPSPPFCPLCRPLLRHRRFCAALSSDTKASAPPSPPRSCAALSSFLSSAPPSPLTQKVLHRPLLRHRSFCAALSSFLSSAPPSPPTEKLLRRHRSCAQSKDLPPSKLLHRRANPKGAPPEKSRSSSTALEINLLHQRTDGFVKSYSLDFMEGNQPREERGCGFFLWHDLELSERTKGIINDLKRDNKKLQMEISELKKSNMYTESAVDCNVLLEPVNNSITMNPGFASEEHTMSADILRRAFQATEEGYLPLVTGQWVVKPQLLRTKQK
ncbi:hypothetical protein ZIOFF_018658 [Zingiber officinale]|uniref:VOC domain-containing protein n=1 Tax=Zingiber officinale TaxID=94328 RepID=A0A8J5LRW6_ZINOF|nr:hypothetical protein ZIOFF_018658 [Zingiber officinale]